MPLAEHVSTIIIGGGLSGLMMGHRLRQGYTIFERSPEPNFNVGGPFYLHSPIDWLPTKWKEVDVVHNCWDGNRFARIPDMEMLNDYSRKITGKLINTSLKFMDGKPKRGHMPASGNPSCVLKDLVEEVRSNIRWGVNIIEIDAEKKRIGIEVDKDSLWWVSYDRLVSTMPLPLLLRMLDVKFGHRFRSDPIHVWCYEVDPDLTMDVYQVVNITAPQIVPYRASLMHRSIFVESMQEMNEGKNKFLLERLWDLDGGFKLVERHIIKPGKFHPIEKTARHMLLAKLTNQYSIYCLGRYAVWDYKRIDHIADDIKTIINIIESRGSDANSL